MIVSIHKQRLFQLSNRQQEKLVFGIVLLCLFLFGMSAYQKLTDHDQFVKGLSRVSFIGNYALEISWFVLAAEIIVSILLLAPSFYRWGLSIFLVMMTVFTIYIGSMLLWAEKLPCHCNLIVRNLSWGEHLAFNIGFIALAVIALRLIKDKNSF